MRRCAEPVDHFGLGVEIEGLKPQMTVRVGAERRPQGLDIAHQGARIVGAAQARLPRPGDAVKDRGDAIGDRLAVAVHQRDVDGKADAGPRHQLPLEGIAMNIDDAGQDIEPARVEGAAIAAIGTDCVDDA